MLVQRRILALGSINLRTGEFKMDQQTFKVGDVVQLRSGGPPMTVSQIIERPNLEEIVKALHCQWFNDQQNLCGEDFLASVLKEY